MKKTVGALLGAAALLLTLTAVAQAKTITVNVTGDPTANDQCITNGPCSLRQAFDNAATGDTIQLGGTSANPVTYSLTQGAQLRMLNDLTIEGGGPGATTIDDSQNRGGS